MDNTQEMLKVLDEVLSLNGRTKHFKSDTPLLGGIPELDSMAVVGVITALEAVPSGPRTGMLLELKGLIELLAQELEQQGS